jgi:hypothetical protein
MGTCIYQGDSRFFIATQDVAQVYRALRDWATRRGDQGLGWAFAEDVFQGANAQEVLTALRWEPSIDEVGNIVGVRFRGEKSGSEADFFQAIARFVKPGSCLNMYSEYGRHWRWVFNGLDCVEQEGRVVYDPVPGYVEGDVIDVAATEVRETRLLSGG